MDEAEHSKERVLIMAPVGRDSELARRMLAQVGLICNSCCGAEDLRRLFSEQIGALLLTEEALSPQIVSTVADFIATQPAWSDLPLILLLEPGHMASRAGLHQLLGQGANLVLLERPVRPTILVNVVQSVLQARRRQYQLRDLLDQLRQEVAERKLAEQALRKARDELEQRVEERTEELVLSNRLLQQEIAERERMALELGEVRRLLTQSREMERLYLARELHDGPMQELTVASFDLTSLAQHLSQEAHIAGLMAINARLARINQTLRLLTNNLRPPVLISFGLAAAIRDYVRRFQQNHTSPVITLSLAANNDLRCEDVALALFRICQQALHNVVQHAQAKQAWIRLQVEPEQIVLEVEDDGCGFEVPEHWVELAREGHLGVVGMAERSESIGAQLEVRSHPGQGALIRVTAPRPPQDDAA